MLTGAFLILVVGILLALTAIMPNHRNLWPISLAADAPSRASFAWIAREPPDDYVMYCSCVSAHDLEDEIARAIHGKAAWAMKKFRRLYAATLSTLLGVVVAVVVGLIESVRMLP